MLYSLSPQLICVVVIWNEHRPSKHKSELEMVLCVCFPDVGLGIGSVGLV